MRVRLGSLLSLAAAAIFAVQTAGVSLAENETPEALPEIGKPDGMDAYLQKHNIEHFKEALKAFYGKDAKALKSESQAYLDAASKAKFPAGERQASLLAIHAQLLEMEKNPSGSNKRGEELKSLSEKVVIGAFEDGALEYDTWLLYARILYRRFENEKSPDVKEVFLKRANDAATKALKVGQKASEWQIPWLHSFKYSGQLTTAIRKQLLEMQKGRKGSFDKNADNVKANDELTTSFRKDESELLDEIKGLEDEAILSTQQTGKESVKLLDSATESEGNEKNAAKPALPSLVSELRAKIAEQIRSWDGTLNTAVKTLKPSEDVKQWRLHSQSRALQAYFENTLPDRVNRMSIQELKATSRLLQEPSRKHIPDAFGVIDASFRTQDPDVNQAVLEHFYESERLSSHQMEQELWSNVFQKRTAEIPSNSRAWESALDSVLAKIFPEPMTSRFVMTHLKGQKDLEGVYHLYLAELIGQQEEKIVESDKPSEMLPKAMHEVLVREIEAGRAHYPLLPRVDLEAQLKRARATPAAPLDQYVKGVIEHSDKSVFFKKTSDRAAVNLAELKLKRDLRLIEDPKAIETFLERKVLKADLPRSADKSVRDELTADLGDLKRWDLPTETLISKVGERPIAIEKVHHDYLESAIHAELQSKSRSTYRDLSAQQIDKAVFEKRIEPKVDSLKASDLSALLGDLRREPRDINSFLTYESGPKALLGEVPASAVPFFLDELRQRDKLTNDELLESLQDWLTKVNDAVFDKPRFEEVLAGELYALGFHDLDPAYVRTRLSSGPMNLKKVYKEFLNLPEAEKKNYFGSLFGSFFSSETPSGRGSTEGFDIDDKKPGKGKAWLYVDYSLPKGARYPRRRFVSADGKYFVPSKSFDPVDAVEPVESEQASDKPNFNGRIYIPRLDPAAPWLLPPDGHLAGQTFEQAALQARFSPSQTQYAGAYVSYDGSSPAGDLLETSVYLTKVHLADPQAYKEYYLTRPKDITLGEKEEAFLSRLVAWRAMPEEWPSEGGKSPEKLTEVYATRAKALTQLEDSLSEMDTEKLDLESPEYPTLAYRAKFNCPNKDCVVAVFLESWLRENFKYTSEGGTPERISSDPDADHGATLQRVAEERAGNCAENNALYQYILKKYFKIPARNVNGFFVSDKAKQEAISFGPGTGGARPVYGISRADGHAWSEVLIEDNGTLGWTTMDATSWQELEDKGLGKKRKDPPQKTRAATAKYDRMIQVLRTETDTRKLVNRIWKINPTEGDLKKFYEHWSEDSPNDASRYLLLSQNAVPHATSANPGDNLFNSGSRVLLKERCDAWFQRTPEEAAAVSPTDLALLWLRHETAFGTQGLSLQKEQVECIESRLLEHADQIDIKELFSKSPQSVTLEHFLRAAVHEGHLSAIQKKILVSELGDLATGIGGSSVAQLLRRQEYFHEFYPKLQAAFEDRVNELSITQPSSPWFFEVLGPDADHLRTLYLDRVAVHVKDPNAASGANLYDYLKFRGVESHPVFPTLIEAQLSKSGRWDGAVEKSKGKLTLKAGTKLQETLEAIVSQQDSEGYQARAREEAARIIAEHAKVQTDKDDGRRTLKAVQAVGIDGSREVSDQVSGMLEKTWENTTNPVELGAMGRTRRFVMEGDEVNQAAFTCQRQPNDIYDVFGISRDLVEVSKTVRTQESCAQLGFYLMDLDLAKRVEGTPKLLEDSIKIRDYLKQRFGPSDELEPDSQAINTRVETTIARGIYVYQNQCTSALEALESSMDHKEQAAAVHLNILLLESRMKKKEVPSPALLKELMRKAMELAPEEPRLVLKSLDFWTDALAAYSGAQLAEAQESVVSLATMLNQSKFPKAQLADELQRSLTRMTLRARPQTTSSYIAILKVLETRVDPKNAQSVADRYARTLDLLEKQGASEAAKTFSMHAFSRIKLTGSNNPTLGVRLEKIAKQFQKIRSERLNGFSPFELESLVGAAENSLMTASDDRGRMLLFEEVIAGGASWRAAIDSPEVKERLEAYLKENVDFHRRSFTLTGDKARALGKELGFDVEKWPNQEIKDW